MRRDGIELDPLSAQSCALAAVDIVAGYDGRRVLDGLTLPVERGKITVLMGPSGVGKTTCIRHFIGLSVPERGQVLFDGRDMCHMSDAELRKCQRRMSVMLQGSILFGAGLSGSLSVFDNVALPLRLRESLGPDEIAERAHHGLEQVGLAGRAHAMPSELSAGMQQRLSLARALVSGSEVVVLDSVETGMDGVRLSVLADIIRAAQRESGATFLVATHHPRLAHGLADVLAVMRRGRIGALGPPEELLGDGDGFAARFVGGDPASGLTMSDEGEGPHKPHVETRMLSDRTITIIGVALVIAFVAMVLLVVVSAVVLNEPTLPPGP